MMYPVYPNTFAVHNSLFNPMNYALMPSGNQGLYSYPAYTSSPYLNTPVYLADYQAYVANYQPYAATYQPYATNYQPYVASYQPYFLSQPYANSLPLQWQTVQAGSFEAHSSHGLEMILIAILVLIALDIIIVRPLKASSLTQR